MDEIIMLVGVQQPLPKIGETLKLNTEISGRKLVFKVKKIQSLQWNNDDQLIIILAGERTFSEEVE